MKWKESYTSLLFILPAVIYVSYFSFYESINAVYQSFQTPRAHFVLSNYQGLLFFDLKDAIINTLILSFGALIVQLLAGLLIASLLLKRFHGKSFFTTLVMIPFGIATVVSGFSFANIFSVSGGYANSLLNSLGLPAINWFSNYWMTMFTLMLADSWKNIPIVTLILFAGMSGISPELYNAAAVDGAGPLERLVHVTIPNLRTYIAIALIIRGVSEFNIFAIPLILVGLNFKLLTVMTYNFYGTSSVYYSYASATILLALILGFAALVVKFRGSQS